MQAEAIPGRIDPSTTPRTISQRVAPSASAPSLSSLGTVRNRSRVIAAMIGSAMIARITIAVKIPDPLSDGDPNNGMKPSTLCSAGSIVERMIGARTTIPQRPMITLGTAASSSTSGPITAAVRGDVSWLR